MLKEHNETNITIDQKIKIGPRVSHALHPYPAEDEAEQYPDVTHTASFSCLTVPGSRTGESPRDTREGNRGVLSVPYRWDSGGPRLLPSVQGHVFPYEDIVNVYVHIPSQSLPHLGNWGATFYPSFHRFIKTKQTWLLNKEVSSLFANRPIISREGPQSPRCSLLGKFDACQTLNTMGRWLSVTWQVRVSASCKKCSWRPQLLYGPELLREFSILAWVKNVGMVCGF